MSERITRRVQVFGRVQGVGFRPYVHRRATALGLDGWVRNVDGHVELVASGRPAALRDLVTSLRKHPPPLSAVRRVEVTRAPGDAAGPHDGFLVRPSGTEPSAAPREIPPDAAICAACLRELFDPADRRHRHPFINCTDCGPRATVVEALPYDRERTTMRHFALCPACRAEYTDPTDRRYHAEPLACPACGPRLAWHEARARTRGDGPAEREVVGEEALRAAVAVVASGGIVAVKGLGGYQVVCDATDPAAVAELRRRKRRPAKPFAVMVRDLADARRLARVSRTEEAVLVSPQRPVVLLAARTPRRTSPRPARRAAGAAVPSAPAPLGPLPTPRDTARSSPDHPRTDRGPVPPDQPGADPARAAIPPDQPRTNPARTAAVPPDDPVTDPALAPSVHPGTDRVGLFLPTTGLHHLLLRELGRPLVVTSGNLSGEPIATDDAEAHSRLSGVVDGFLSHDRPIRARYDDSVVQVVRRTPLMLRRARGYAPAPLALPAPAALPLVGAGAQLKHTVTLAERGRAHLGPHTGDLADATTYEAFEAAYADLARLTGIEPAAVAHDLHPGYLSTQWARGLPVTRRIAVQHHHAHVAAVAAEHRLTGPFVGVAYDGLGLGDDGTLWGGEILVADLTGYRRVGRFARAPLPGGEAAVRHPARMALGYLFGAEPLGGPRPGPGPALPFTGRLPAREVRAVRAMVERSVNCPQASSAGRLFDAVASLLGLGDTVSYEGQAALALESAAGDLRVPALPWRLTRAGSLWVYDPSPTLAALLEGLAAGTPVARSAAAFHATVAEVTDALVGRVVAAGGPRTVCLGGGCFQNRRLLADVSRLLRARGLRVLTGHAVPVNDGGISYGQAAVASALLSREE
ncbi:Sua5/YciO/YrdC/YwlC family protein [Streptomyces sp. NPDC020801]|uniref:carbamoyltransferase HypF n=1 Tax=Streptomyces sp. NPDC020801 TaxID=3365093 RepID=UPI003790E970